MKKTERIKQIQELLLKEHSLSINQLTIQLNISEPTARRDINYLLLHYDNYLRIPNGIGLKNKGHQTEFLFEKKLKQYIEQKNKIAIRCEQILQDGDIVLLDSGSTCYYIAQQLFKKNLQIITTDLRITLELNKYPNISLHTIGGSLRQGHYTLLGQIALQNLQQIHVPIAIISGDAFDIDYGLSNIEILEVASKQQIRKITDKLILAIDSSKFNKKSFYQVLTTSNIDMIITDSGISSEYQQLITNQGIHLEIT